MELTIYQIDAFAEKVSEGNSAAVCPLDVWLPDGVLQNIALENNLSETAFFVKEKNKYNIRWFTPTLEIDLCGHATLASAYVIFDILGIESRKIIFHSKSGEIKVRKRQKLIELDFPVSKIHRSHVKQEITDALGKNPVEVWKSEDYLVIYENESDILSLSPNFNALLKLDCRGVIVTAEGQKADFVSRFFAPKCGINEDPVTGSAHCSLIPYWSGRLKKSILFAEQLSKRGGKLQCEISGERILIAGKAVKYLEGKINI